MKHSPIFSKIIILLAFFVSTSCVKEPEILPASIPTDQEVFFEVNYINYAWGEQASSFFINKLGEIKSFKGKIKWNNEASKGQLSELQMKENLDLAKISKKTITISDLSKYSLLIPKITSSNFTKRKAVGADMGGYSYYAYVYNSNEKVYKAIKLAEAGDWESYNEDPNAKIIFDWLKEIQTVGLF
jgi:hypothetical protein